MADGLKDIIAQLERQKAAIDRALSSLRTLEESEAPAQVSSAPEASPRKTARRKVRITPEGRKRLAEAMKRRWAVKRTAAQAGKRSR
jgi:hypothetical protein